MKFIKKVSISCLIVLFSLNTNIFAENQNDIPTQSNIVNLSNNITPRQIQEIVDDIDASLISEDGNIMPIDCNIKIEDIPSNTYDLNSINNKSYNVTIQAKVPDKEDINTYKILSDSDNNNGINKSFQKTGINQVAMTPSANYTVKFKNANLYLNVSVTATPFD